MQLLHSAISTHATSKALKLPWILLGFKTMDGQKRWLEVQADTGTCVYTISRCLTLADLQADGDYKLVTADIGGPQYQLKVLKGMTVVSEITLPELPVGVISVYNDTRSPRIPLTLVASGPSVYAYRNLKPYYKFSLPLLQVNALEMDLWIQARDKEMEPKALYEMLVSIQQELGFARLSQQSQRLLTVPLDREAEIRALVSAGVDQPLTRRTVITCMAALKRSSSDADAVSCLVLGSEDGGITLVDVEAFTVLDSFQQCEVHGIRTVPVSLYTSGLWDVEFRIVVNNRDGKVTLLRRGWKQTKLLIQLSVQPVDMVLLETGNLIIANRSSFECYSKKGRRLWEEPLPSPPLNLATLFLEHQGVSLTAVALSGGDVYLYNGRNLVDSITAPDSVSALTFGRFGQEDHCLILVTASGGLQVQILKRTAQFPNTCSKASQQIIPKLSLPKRTRLLVEQVAYERENAIEIHQSFQRGLFKLRLDAARQLSESLETSSNIISGDPQLPLKMSAQVFGLGPTFKVRISIDNMAPSLNTKTLQAPCMRLVFHYNHQLYQVLKPVQEVPFLVPGLVYTMDTIVTTLGEVLVSEDLLVFLVSADSAKPLLATTVHIPVCDLLPIEI